MTKITKSKVLMLLIAITFTGILGTISFSATGDAQDDDDDDSGGSWIWWQNSQSSEGKAIPDWVDQNFRWYGQGQITQTELLNAMKYLLDNNIMFISEEAATEVQQLRDENIKLKIVLGEQIEEITDVEIEKLNKNESYWVDITMPDGSSYSCSSLQKTEGEQARLTDASDVCDEQATSTGGDLDELGRIKVQFPWMTADLDFASQTVDNILRKGGGITHWDNEIDSFSQNGMSESDVPELVGTVVLFNIAIDKKAQSIDAELKILEMWLEIISNEQESSSFDAPDRLTSDTIEATVQYRESDFNFISRTLSSIDQQIKALDTGIVVLEEKLSSIGDDAQLANIDLQNSLQKQQQTLQTMSNVSKILHDTQMSIIQNMR